VGCARSELEEPSPRLPRGYHPLPGVAEPLWVPPGEVWIGPIEVNPSFELEAAPCDPDYLGRQFLLIEGVFLDQDEVRGRDYDQCVERQLCAPVPMSEPNLPITLEPAQLEAYCTFRGGRLPTAAELARASAGDDFGLTTARFYEGWVSCDHDFFTSESCRELAKAAPATPLGSSPPAGLQPIRSVSSDRGPYGHWDVFGSLPEITQTRSPLPNEPFWCAPPAWFPAPTTFASESGSEEILIVHAPAWALAVEAPMQPSSLNNVVLGVGFLANLRETGLFGGRCAYDPEYDLPGE
jgi:hypothetical protein